MTSLPFKLLPLLLLIGSLAIAGSKTIDGGAGTNAVEINVGVDDLRALRELALIDWFIKGAVSNELHDLGMLCCIDHVAEWVSTAPNMKSRHIDLICESYADLRY